MYKYEAYKTVLKEARQRVADLNEGESCRIVLLKGDHFIERFVKRYGDDIVAFQKIINAFVGMLQMRRKFYYDLLSKRPEFQEQSYTYFGQRIHFSIERGIPCRGDDDGTNTLVKLSTYYKVK
jgi:hypothetical protein